MVMISMILKKKNYDGGNHDRDITTDARQTTGDRREYKNQHTPALARIVIGFSGS